MEKIIITPSKACKKYKPIDVEEFKNNITKERAYFLGFLWADGTIRNTSISIEIKSTDMTVLRDIFFKTCEWGEYHRSRPGRSPQSTISRTNKAFSDYLRSYDFHIKSKTSPTKILSELSEENKKYFYRGWIDGDGCFYYNSKRHLRQFTICGSYNQDWSGVIELFTNLNIEYNINFYTSKLNHTHSVIRIINSKGIVKLYKYLYDSKDGIYLQRKLDKCEQLLGIVGTIIGLNNVDGEDNHITDN